MKILKRINITFTIIAVIVLASIISYIMVLMKVSDDLELQTKDHLNEIATELGSHINSKVDERFSILATYSYYISSGEELSEEELEGFAKICAEKENLTSIKIIDYDENIVSGCKNTIKKETDSDGNNVIAFYLPVKNDNKSYIIKGTCKVEDFNKYVSVAAFGQTGNSFILDREGNVITDTDNTFTLDNIFKDNKKYGRKVISSIQSKNSGNMVYISGKNKRYICYSNIEYNNWYVVVIVSSGIVESKYDNVNKRGIILTGVLLFVFAIMIAYIFYFNHRYALYKKIVDERREIYAKQTGYMLFDYKVKRKYLAISGDLKNISGHDGDAGFFIEDNKIPFITEKSNNEIYSLFQNDLKDIDTIDDIPVELIDINKEIKTVRVSMTTIKLKNGKIVRVVGSAK